MNKNFYPFGYNVVDGKIVKINSEQETLAIMRKMQLNGKGPYEIATYLNKNSEKYPARSGQWHGTTVRTILNREKEIMDGKPLKSFFSNAIKWNDSEEKVEEKKCIDIELGKSGVEVIDRSIWKSNKHDGEEITLYLLRRFGVLYCVREDNCERISIPERNANYYRVQFLPIDTEFFKWFESWYKEFESSNPKKRPGRPAKEKPYTRGANDFYAGVDNSGEYIMVSEKMEYECGWFDAMKEVEKNKEK